MNKKIVAILATTTLLLSGCSEKTIEFNNSLMEKYDFYEKSVIEIINTMDVSSQQADDIFVTLVGLGLDKEILSIFKHNDNYTLFISGKYLTITLTNGELTKITDGFNNILYPAPEISSTPSEPETLEDSQESLKVIPLEITGHHFEEKNVYGYKEVQLFIKFNRALSEQELGTLMVPNYTYKYILSTEIGEDFTVDYGNGHSLSDIYFNDDFTEYQLENSGNGMREGRYTSDPLFNQDNITSIKVQIYKKINDDKYDHNYELLTEYIYPNDQENANEAMSSN